MGQKIFASAIIILFLYVTSPLIVPVLMGAIFAVLVYPLVDFLSERSCPKWLSSAALTGLVTVIFLVPAAFLIFYAARTGLSQFQYLQDIQAAPTSIEGMSFVENLINLPSVQHFLESISRWFPISVTELIDSAQRLAGIIGLSLANGAAQFLAQVPGMAMGLAVIVVSLFFFLLDGPYLIEFLRAHSFFKPDQTNSLLDAFGRMCRSVILATVVSGLAQTLLFSVACISTGTGNVAMIALLTFLASFVPLIGSALVTIPVAGYQLLLGSTTEGIVLLFVAIFVTALDNLIRPLVMKGAGNLHPLMAFLAAFGGLQVIGISGVFMGPIIAGVFVVMIQILVQKKRQMIKRQVTKHQPA